MMNAAKNAGVALITALLVVSLAATAAVALSLRQALDVHRTGNLINSDQAWLYAKGGEAWAKVFLVEDRRDNDIDSLEDSWAKTLPPIKLPGGFIVGNITDQQGRFNINNLLEGNKVSPPAMARFRRLLARLELEPELAEAVVDWLDKDIEPMPPNGAEDDYYVGLETPYRTANRPMVNVSELRLVKGFDQETYEKVAPFLTALPERTTINVNTAPGEVLASLSDRLSLDFAKGIIEQREDEPFDSIDEFLNSPLVKELNLSSEDTDDLGVSSQYFLVRSETRIGDGRATVDSLIRRGDEDNIRILHRKQAELL